MAPQPNIDALGGPTPENQNGTDFGTDLSLGDPSTSPLKRQSKNGEEYPELTDVTKSVLEETIVSYPLQGVPSVAYNTTDGYEFLPLVDPTQSLALVACGNGNVYVVNSASKRLEFCPEIWSVYGGLLVGDAAGRILHFYSNTMSKVEVSRLRVSDGRDFPKESVPVVFARPKAGSNATANGQPTPQNNTAPAADVTSMFVAADPDLNFYYPIVCAYTTNTPPRLSVVADPIAGVSMLQSNDVVYSITGGSVDSCAMMPIEQGKYGGDLEISLESMTMRLTLSWSRQPGLQQCWILQCVMDISKL